MTETDPTLRDDVQEKCPTCPGETEMSTTHADKKPSTNERTVYDRAERLERVCIRGRKPGMGCSGWRMSYEGDELDALLRDDGSMDPDEVDKYCPLCGGTVEEHLYDEDGEEILR